MRALVFASVLFFSVCQSLIANAGNGDDPTSYIYSLINEMREVSSQPACAEALLAPSVRHDFTLHRLGSPIQIIEAIHRDIIFLRNNGSITIRDLMVPAEEGRVIITAETEVAAQLSLNEHESKLPSEGEWQRFEVDLDTAMEFAYRLWDPYAGQHPHFNFTQLQWRQIFQPIGVRVLVSRPLPELRLSSIPGRVYFADNQGRALNTPYGILLNAQKVSGRNGTEAVELHSRDLRYSQDFKFEYFRNRDNGSIEEIISFGHRRSLIAVPFYIEKDKIFLVSRTPSLRPLLNMEVIPLHGATFSGHMGSPFTFELDSVKQSTQSLSEILGSDVRSAKAVGVHYTDVTSSLEPSQIVSVQIRRTDDDAFAKSTQIEVKDASQTLAQMQSTGLAEMNWEIAIYRVMLQNKILPDNWSGNPLDVVTSSLTEEQLKRSSIKFAREKAWRRLSWYRRQPRPFWQLRHSDFSERSGSGMELRRVQQEYVVPRQYSTNVISILPVTKINGEIWIGLENVASPVPQRHREPSRIWAVPRLRVPKGLTNLDSATIFARYRIEKIYGVKFESVIPLGTEYRTDLDISPEAVYPHVGVVSDATQFSKLSWFPLKTLLDGQSELREGHLLISLFRFAHATNAFRGIDM